MTSITYTRSGKEQVLVDAQRLKVYGWIGLAFLVITALSQVAERETFWARALNEGWRSVYVVAANFLFFEHVVPRLSTKKAFRSLALLAGQFLVFSFGLYVWRWLGISVRVWTDLATGKHWTDIVCNQLQHSLSAVLFFGLILHVYDHIKLKQTAQQLRIEKQEAELNYLKSQTNPHFLFNTLNNIYSLARDKSDLAPESILRLSEILRFMLYKTSGEYIAVGQEVKIIEDYISLEKLRYDDSLRVHFEQDIRDLQQPLPPLLLIPLVENAFKHGVSETRDQPFVDIHLRVDPKNLTFSVRNSREKSPDDNPGIKEKIGLTNLRRQLELLYTEYALSVHQTETTFTANLKINLSSHV